MVEDDEIDSITEAQSDWNLRLRAGKLLGLSVLDACHPLAVELGKRYGVSPVWLETESNGNLDLMFELVQNNLIGGTNMDENEVEKSEVEQAWETLTRLERERAVKKAWDILAAAHELDDVKDGATAPPPAETLREKERQRIMGTSQWKPTREEFEAMDIEQHRRLRLSGWDGTYRVEASESSPVSEEEEPGLTPEEAEKMSMEEYAKHPSVKARYK